MAYLRLYTEGLGERHWIGEEPSLDAWIRCAYHHLRKHTAIENARDFAASYRRTHGVRVDEHDQ